MTDEAAELRELCASFAIQAGAKGAAQIIGLAEELKAYIQFGPEALQRSTNGLRPDQLNEENDG